MWKTSCPTAFVLPVLRFIDISLTGSISLRHHLSSGLEAVCTGGSPQSVQTLFWTFSQRSQSSARSPSPYQSNQGEQATGTLLSWGRPAVWPTSPAWWLALLLKQKLETRRSEVPKPGSHSSVGCRAEKINKQLRQTSELLSFGIASWCSTCSGHKATLMSPWIPLGLNIDSWDPVVKERIAFLPYKCRKVTMALHSTNDYTCCNFTFKRPWL